MSTDDMKRLNAIQDKISHAIYHGGDNTGFLNQALCLIELIQRGTK